MDISELWLHLSAHPHTGSQAWRDQFSELCSLLCGLRDSVRGDNCCLPYTGTRCRDSPGKVHAMQCRKNQYNSANWALSRDSGNGCNSYPFPQPEEDEEGKLNVISKTVPLFVTIEKKTTQLCKQNTDTFICLSSQIQIKFQSVQVTFNTGWLYVMCYMV